MGLETWQGAAGGSREKRVICGFILMEEATEFASNLG